MKSKWAGPPSAGLAVVILVALVHRDVDVTLVTSDLVYFGSSGPAGPDRAQTSGTPRGKMASLSNMAVSSRYLHNSEEQQQ